jgi:hypothetical protein
MSTPARYRQPTGAPKYLSAQKVARVELMTEAPPEAQKTWTECESCGKRGYASQRAANLVRKQLRNKARVYWCKGGGMWHLAHAEKLGIRRHRYHMRPESERAMSKSQLKHGWWRKENTRFGLDEAA